MVSTPGDGLSELGARAVVRAAVERFNVSGAETEHLRRQIGELLDSLPNENVEVWPIIVAAGKGSRAMESGLSMPKPVAPIYEVPAINHVLANIRAAANISRPPIVIVSPETELEVRQALSGQEIHFQLQGEPKGTGDAVLRAYERMRDFTGRALIIWSTQPVVTSQSISRTIKLSRLFEEFEMVVPTALKERPYAPLVRDSNGRVLASRETHLEKADVPEIGETNCGMFLLDNQRMFEALLELRNRHWLEVEQSYDRPGGELGFPNEMISYFAARNSGVLASPILDEREVQGIKTLDDVARCERFIAELSAEKA
jgi:bifunctional N-acetylglucosamine-1-phosphate-uridyltransferase/glucosamine-1-phosphate-acetyltransferase GlmU-like protein